MRRAEPVAPQPRMEQAREPLRPSLVPLALAVAHGRVAPGPREIDMAHHGERPVRAGERGLGQGRDERRLALSGERAQDAGRSVPPLEPLEPYRIRAFRRGAGAETAKEEPRSSGEERSLSQLAGEQGALFGYCQSSL